MRKGPRGAMGLSPGGKRVRVRLAGALLQRVGYPLLLPLHAPPIPTLPKLSLLSAFAHALLHCLEVLLSANTSSHCQGYGPLGFLQEVFPDDPRTVARALAVSTDVLAWVTDLPSTVPIPAASPALGGWRNVFMLTAPITLKPKAPALHPLPPPPPQPRLHSSPPRLAFLLNKHSPSLPPGLRTAGSPPRTSSPPCFLLSGFFSSLRSASQE